MDDMVTILFSVFVILCIAVIACSNLEYIPQLEACNLNFVLPKKLVHKDINKKVLINDVFYNLEKYKPFYVEGNALSNYGIENHEYVFVEQLKTYESKNSITGNPLIITNCKYAGFDYYKPYKFITYLNIDHNPLYTNWIELYDSISKKFNIKVKKESFKKMMINCIKECDFAKRFVILEKYDIENMKFLYYAYRVEQIYGIIKYSQNKIFEK